MSNNPNTSIREYIKFHQNDLGYQNEDISCRNVDETTVRPNLTETLEKI